MSEEKAEYDGPWTFATSVWPVNLVFHDIGSVAPTKDITPREAVQLVMMLVSAMQAHHIQIDYKSFVEEHNLQRHFRKQHGN